MHLYVSWSGRTQACVAFEIKGTIETQILSLKTIYAAYLVFKFVDPRYGFETRPVGFGVYFDENDNGERHRLVLDPPKDMPQLSQDRADGWMSSLMKMKMM